MIGQRAYEAFKAIVTIDPSSGCWVWPGEREWFEYPHFLGMGAHRFSWLHHWGVIPHGLFVCHDCDNKSCVNPVHLFLGTQSDNMTDRVLKHAHRVQIRGLWDFLGKPENMEKYRKNDRVLNALVSGSIPLQSRCRFDDMGVVFEKVLLPRVSAQSPV